jgi:hypothetical protein
MVNEKIHEQALNENYLRSQYDIHMKNVNDKSIPVEIRDDEFACANYIHELISPREQEKVPTYRIEGLGKLVSNKGVANYADIQKGLENGSLTKIYSEPCYTMKNGKKVMLPCDQDQNLIEKASDMYNKARNHVVKNGGVFWRGLLSSKVPLKGTSYAALRTQENTRNTLENIEDVICATAIAIPAFVALDKTVQIAGKYLADHYDTISNVAHQVIQKIL